MLIQNHYILFMILLLYNKKDLEDKKFWSILGKKISVFHIIDIRYIYYYTLSRAENDACWK